MEDSLLYQRIKFVQNRPLLWGTAAIFFIITLTEIWDRGTLEPLFLIIGFVMQADGWVDRKSIKNVWINIIWVVAMFVCFIWYRDGIVLWT